MKKLSVIIILFLLGLPSWANPVFENYFTDGVLRFDCLLSGNREVTQVLPSEMKHEPFWGGSKTNLIDVQDYGTFRFQLFTADDQTLIFSRGFSPIFQEWQTTAEAKSISRAFEQVIRFPFPKQAVKLVIERRNRDGKFDAIYNTTINPANYFIRREKPEPVDHVMVLNSGDPAHKIDIAFVAEGYTAAEMDKFVADVRRLTDSLFVVAPYSEMKSYFNLYALKTPSFDSGTDIPGEGIYANTAFNSTFYTFDISRYLTTSSMITIHDKAASVPYDQLYVLVNSTRYGGGGFYNFLNVGTVDHPLSAKVFIHEFGHGFAGLGDEYYTSEVAYEDYYNLEVEPWEPNITTLVDFGSKWKALIDKKTPIPTPRGAGYADKTGVFEGGGYMAKGIYSPMEDCRMKSNGPNYFCPVCQKAIRETILLNTK